jgi:putative zinc finger protein
MQVTDDDLRRVALGPASSREACPPGETLAAALAGELEGPEREAVLEHLGRCRDCAEEVQLLRPLASWTETVAGRLQEARPAETRLRSGWARWPAWAAAALVLLGLPLLLLREQGSSPLRSPAGATIRSALPESALPREQCLLRWSDMGEGARYGVSVLGKDLRPLAGADGLERPEYLVPVEALKTVPARGEIVWSVEARWEDGRRLASTTFLTRLD